MEIYLITQPGLSAPELSRADAALRELLATSGRTNAEITVILTDDARIRALNLQWRQIDNTTDVLSWPQDVYGEAGAAPERSAGDADILGDIVISLDTARQQALTREWGLGDEVALLAVHGGLHLLGYEDETELGAERMRKMETRILGKPLEKFDESSG